MKRCLHCATPFDSPVIWASLFTNTESPLCPDCLLLFNRIDESAACPDCSRPDTGGQQCSDCERWKRGDDPLLSNLSFYPYHDDLKEWLSRLKFKSDWAQASCFAAPLAAAIRPLQKTHLIVPIPLSEGRLMERGYNQIEALLTEAGIRFHPVLSKYETGKSSKKTRRERAKELNPFFIPQNSVITRPVLLIDDLYTTGITLRHASSILQQHGASSVQSITIGRTIAKQ